jgi:hypothetical protein
MIHNETFDISFDIIVRYKYLIIILIMQMCNQVSQNISNDNITCYDSV